MRVRPTPVLLLACALAAGSLALLNRQPLVVALAFAVAGAAAARLASAAGGAAARPPTEAPSLTARTSPPAPESQAPPPAAADSPVPAAVPAGELLEAMMDSMREGLLVVDAEMRVVATNPAARDLFGAAGEKSQGRRLSDLTRNPAVLSAFLAALERAERVEVKVETIEAAPRAYDLRVAPLQPRAPGGPRRGAVGVFFDITRLERLERVRQEFLSNVSHELRTPLTAIRTYVETLADGAIDDAAHNRRFLSVIDRNAARMHGLIDDILELSAIEAGKVAVEPAAVALRPLVGEVVTTLAARAGERRVELRNEVPEDVIVRADARRLEQMLTNLADNAVKFNREGGSVVIAHARAGGRDQITVSDTGEGIPPEHIHRIFERFYRVDRARARALGGTGLGLAIVKHLARAHGGEVAVQSALGRGSSFTIELPCVRSDAA